MQLMRSDVALLTHQIDASKMSVAHSIHFTKNITSQRMLRFY